MGIDFRNLPQCLSIQLSMLYARTNTIELSEWMILRTESEPGRRSGWKSWVNLSHRWKCPFFTRAPLDNKFVIPDLVQHAWSWMSSCRVSSATQHLQLANTSIALNARCNLTRRHRLDALVRKSVQEIRRTTAPVTTARQLVDLASPS